MTERAPVESRTPGRPSVGVGAGTPRLAAIRATALELFATKGYRATTMSDIGERVGLRGPSLYKHVSSKQELLVEIMLRTMERLLADQRAAVATTTDVKLQLRRAAEAHARYHARHRFEAFVGTRELDNLEEPHRSQVLDLRRAYEHSFRAIIEAGCAEGRFCVASPRLASFAFLDMGMGIAVWFRPDGPLSEHEIAYAYGDFALRMVGAG